MLVALSPALSISFPELTHRLLLLLSRFSHVRLCDPIDSSSPGSPVPGILQARALEWVAISFSNARKWKVKVKLLSRVRLFATPQTGAHQAPPSMGLSRQEYWSGLPLPSPNCLFILFDQCSNKAFFLTARERERSVAQSCPTLWDPMNHSTPDLPVHHQLPEFTQTHVHRVSDTIQPSHPLSSSSPPAPNPSQHQSLFQWVNSLHEVAKVLEFQLWHHSFQRNQLEPGKNPKCPSLHE